MKIKTITDFEKALKKCMAELFGNCDENDGVLRSAAEEIGVTDTTVVIEAAMEDGINEDDPFHILHFHTTLAQNIEEETIPGILKGLNDLNNAISVGSYPFLGNFVFFPPLNQIYLSYRMTVNPENLDNEIDNAVYYLNALCDKLNVFADFILFLCADPEKVSFDAYLEYLRFVIDTEHTEERLDMLEDQVNEVMEELKEAEKKFRE